MHAGDPTGGVPREGEGEQGQQSYQAEMFLAPKNIQITAMDSP